VAIPDLGLNSTSALGICLPAAGGREWFAMALAEKTRSGVLERVLEGLDWLAARRGRPRELPAHLLTGVEGEDAAYFYLRRKGYTVVARRWSAGNVSGDLDLIAWDGPLLCFFEVKTRTAHDMTPAEAAVDLHKRRTLRRLARNYIRQLPGASAPQARFDVISVYLVPGKEREFAHFENAFSWSERGRD
jgi:putative endonuclease